MVEDLDPSSGSLKVFQVSGKAFEYTYRQLSYSKCTEESFELEDVREEVRAPYLNFGTYCIDDVDEVLFQGAVSDKEQSFIEILIQGCKQNELADGQECFKGEETIPRRPD